MNCPERVKIVNRSGWLGRGLLAFLLVLFLGQGAFALDVGQHSGAPVTLQADRLTYDKSSNTYQATGRVLLRRGELTLLSDRMVFDAATNQASASGHVRVVEPAGVMQGKTLHLNLLSGRGRLGNGRIFLKKRNFHLTGAEIEKLGAQSYRVTNGTFTTCNGQPPSWKFRASRVEVTPGGYATARHVVFYLRDVPVLYLPYLIYPANRERQSGLLMPLAGYSTKRGMQLSLAYYQVIAPNMDATFYLDYLSKLGVGKGVEYRYLLEGGTKGTLHVYQITGLHGAADRYAFDWRHFGLLPGGVQLAADSEYVSDRHYFSDFGEAAGEYNKDMVQSVIYLQRNWDKINLTGQVKYIKDLVRSNEETLQRLPEIRLAVIRRRLGRTPFYFRFDTDANYFWRQQGLTGERLSLRPALSAAFHPADALSIVPEIGYRERLYSTSQGDRQKGLFDFSTRVSTRLSRVFATGGGGITKIQHVLEPEVTYHYIPDADEEELPQFDAADRIGPQNKISVGLTNRFISKGTSAGGSALYREFLYLRLAEDYDFDHSRPELLYPWEQPDPFSALRGELIYRPASWANLDLDGSYDTDAGAFATFNVRGEARDRAGNGLAFDYRHQREAIDYFTGRLDLALFKPVFLDYQHRVDFSSGRTLEKVVNLEYRAQCWSVFFTFRDRLDNREYLINFSLSGLTKVAKLGGDLRPPEK